MITLTSTSLNLLTRPTGCYPFVYLCNLTTEYNIPNNELYYYNYKPANYEVVKGGERFNNVC